jgi:large subunit ribosomal protein L23
VNPYSVLLKPLLSEKSNRGRENENKYTFLVEPKSSKTDVKKAVEKVFSVSVVGVTTLITRGKVKRRGNNVSKLANTKKAVVTLKEGEKISLFEDL